MDNNHLEENKATSTAKEAVLSIVAEVLTDWLSEEGISEQLANEEQAAVLFMLLGTAGYSILPNAAASPAPAVAGEAGQWLLEKTKTRFHIEKGHNGINGIFWALHAKVKTLVQAEERVASYREGWPDFDLWRIAEVSITKHKKQTAAAPTTQQKSPQNA